MRRLNILILFYLILLSLSLSCCHESDNNHTVVVIDDPPPKISNCVRDDSFPRIISSYVCDTSTGVSKAVLNYDYKHIASVVYRPEIASNLFVLKCRAYFDKECEYQSESLSFYNLPCTKDTIFLQSAYINSNIDKPVAIFLFLDEDTIDKWLDLDTTKRNYIVFTETDTVNRILRANYWLQFLEYDQFLGEPRKLRFCDGELWVRY
jgi:hypothetical protein